MSTLGEHLVDEWKDLLVMNFFLGRGLVVDSREREGALILNFIVWAGFSYLKTVVAHNRVLHFG